MMKLRHMVLLVAAATALAGCGEREQSAGQGGTSKKSDAKAWQGAQANAYSAPGWTAGDKDSWEAQMKTRARQGQDEYTRAAANSGAGKP